MEIVGDILNFVNKFSMFQDIKPFMGSLYKCITNTLEIKPDSIYDFEDLLTKNALMHFVQEHINYSKITQKDQVLGFLADSLEKLESQPLIMNLGILLKPMYKDQEYLNSLKRHEEIEVSYDVINDSEKQVKTEIDSWLKAQDINLESQEELTTKLLTELDRLFSRYDILKTSEESKKLNFEAIEMLNLKLTMLSLMDQFPDDSGEPIPIK
ncbi:MAG: hypothetical protein KAX18_10140 [Candidatus Lokiarchaeota archaeon]|nr:hypothetical protein [Candidatus Lokiarchaeota archaeon]